MTSKLQLFCRSLAGCRRSAEAIPKPSWLPSLPVRRSRLRKTPNTSLRMSQVPQSPVSPAETRWLPRRNVDSTRSMAQTHIEDTTMTSHFARTAPNTSEKVFGVALQGLITTSSSGAWSPRLLSSASCVKPPVVSPESDLYMHTRSERRGCTVPFGVLSAFCQMNSNRCGPSAGLIRRDVPVVQIPDRPVTKTILWLLWRRALLSSAACFKLLVVLAVADGCLALSTVCSSGLHVHTAS